MAKQAERRALTRQNILDAAAALFATHGFDATSVDAITAAARVAKGTFYQHFDTKLDVMFALLRRQQDESMGAFLAALEAGTPPLEVGLTLVRGIAKWCEDRGRVAGELMLRAMERPEQPQSSSARNMFGRVFQAAQARGEIRADVSADILSITVLAAMIPQIVHWSRFPSAGNLREWLELTWRLMLEGALPRRGGTA
ncbi:MAG: TetR/AcrR family transcriptional regulator [Bryobacteraceae bacterium]|jgi:AcrR family transcriptional regulator